MGVCMRSCMHMCVCVRALAHVFVCNHVCVRVCVFLKCAFVYAHTHTRARAHTHTHHVLRCIAFVRTRENSRKNSRTPPASCRTFPTAWTRCATRCAPLRCTLASRTLCSAAAVSALVPALSISPLVLHPEPRSLSSTASHLVLRPVPHCAMCGIGLLPCA